MRTECLLAKNYRAAMSYIMQQTESGGAVYLGVSSSSEGMPLAHLRIPADHRLVRETLLSEMEWVEHRKYLTNEELFDQLVIRHGTGSFIPIACCTHVHRTEVPLDQLVQNQLATAWRELTDPNFAADVWVGPLPEKKKAASFWSRLFKRR